MSATGILNPMKYNVLFRMRDYNKKVSRVAMRNPTRAKVLLADYIVGRNVHGHYVL